MPSMEDSDNKEKLVHGKFVVESKSYVLILSSASLIAPTKLNYEISNIKVDKETTIVVMFFIT